MPARSEAWSAAGADRASLQNSRRSSLPTPPSSPLSKPRTPASSPPTRPPRPRSTPIVLAPGSLEAALEAALGQSARAPGTSRLALRNGRAIPGHLPEGLEHAPGDLVDAASDRVPTRRLPSRRVPSRRSHAEPPFTACASRGVRHPLQGAGDVRLGRLSPRAVCAVREARRRAVIESPTMPAARRASASASYCAPRSRRSAPAAFPQHLFERDHVRPGALRLGVEYPRLRHLVSRI